MNLEKRRVLSPAVENYLKVIYKLQQEKGEALTTQLAQRMGTTPAAVTKMLKQLASLNLIEYTPYYGARLTPSGERIALEIIRHHRLIELYLHRALGYSWDEVDAEAEILEHYISEEFEDRIDHLLNFPRTDPHGAPIPTREGKIAPVEGTLLEKWEVGRKGRVVRVRDSSPEALRALHQLGIYLGAQIEVMKEAATEGSLTIKVDGVPRSIGRDLARWVFVNSGLAPAVETVAGEEVAHGRES